MKTLISIVFITCITFSLHANEGKNLFMEANCQKCHGGNDTFDALNEKVKSISELEAWVSRCATNLNTGWFPEEETQVVEYLNETHYHLK